MMSSDNSWREGYVRIGSVRVRVRQEDGRVGEGECCCGGPWSSRLPAAKNNSGSSLGVPSRRGPASFIPAALDRLPNFHLGPAPNKKKTRSSDKSDRLRELTERLKGPGEQKVPVEDFDLKLTLQKPEERTIVGSYIQRTIPFRSASFSQVDFSPTDGKYNIRNARNIALANKAGASLSLPRKKTSSEKSPVSPSTSLPLGSGASIDSAVGSQEWSLPKSEKPPECKQNRSLTHPLSWKDSAPADALSYGSVDGNGLKGLGCGDRTLRGVKEESDTDSAAATSETLSQPVSPPPDHWFDPVPNITSITPSTQNPSSEPTVYHLTPTDILAEPEETGEEFLKDIIEEETNSEGVLVESASKKNNTSLNRTCSLNSTFSEADNKNEKGVRSERSWTVGECVRRLGEWASSAQEEPQSPEETSIRLMWPKPGERKWADRPKLICQSSEEKEEERGSPRRFPILNRNDSLSEGESDNGCRTTPNRNSPSLFAPSDLSDGENKLTNQTRSPQPPRRYSKKPIRGPYGQMLEAEMKKPETRKFTIHHDDLKFLEEFGQPSKPVRQRTMDDSHLKRSYTSPEPSDSVKSGSKRKVNENVPFGGNKPEVHHQRTTSSPSQLEGCSKDKGPQPSHQLLAQLLKGSSERSLIDSNPLHQLTNSPSYWKDTRTLVVVELYETERSYVESLQTLVLKYLQPLKCPDNTIIDVGIVDEIFYQIPEILAHHEAFLEELRKRLENWDLSQKVGDVFLDTFTKQSVIESYTNFINNWENAKEAIKTNSQSKPAFARFLETMAREHKGKLALDSLLIMPVQRIPRYELLIQTLLKHTEPSHGDASILVNAQQAIHELAVTINLGQHKTLNPRTSNCQELSLLESIIEGLAGLSTPERTFLCHDQVSITTSQGRKDRALFLFNDLLVITSIKRRSGTIRKTPQSMPGSVVNTLEGNKFKLLMKIPLDDLEIVKDDTVRKMLKEMEQLNSDVSTLSQMAELVTTLHCPHSQLEENVREMLSALNKQLTERHAADSQLSYLELTINTHSGMENIALIFSKPEKRTIWEETFNGAKQRLALTGERRAMPELVSAVPIRKTRAGLQFTCAAPTHGPGPRDVWVCNSDGYVGQVCILSLHPEPTVTSCNGVCNARILCIAPVPGLSNESTSCINCNSGISISVEDADKSPNIHLDSSSSSEDEEREDENEPQVSEDTLTGTMWLGTEDGYIHVYNCTDNIRTKKNKVKIQHNASVQNIIYLENMVFVALANGDVTVYFREANGNWNTSDPVVVSVGSTTVPVKKMTPINGRLWCSCSTSIKILNISSLTVEHSFVVSGESNRSVTSITVSGLSVWISLHNSSTIRLFHAASYEWLGEINVAPAVTKMLASSDDIIRQHKSACLRITALLACKDLLWIGTSAGVLLTMPLPHVTPTTTKLTTIPNVSGVPHGHTGHVRFLTTIDMSLSSVADHKKKSSFHKKQDSSKLLVISGGDGYEDFRSTGISEVAGREDSTNHLLLWHV
ncbi:rho guanine nucleotide exchange factor 17 isoform X2 [Cimex lectularius]|uniref:DH domain-containing protein n=1 Tax=Cimex lectularius TaxID=79782 RepID=A0A8I6SJX7_CIMLE|nr:rho guanine nucleotide exchange factor 17 isoform X2 [Cimex lectularius]